MDILGDDDAGETSAVNSKIRRHYPYRDWCRACVGGTGRSDAHKRQREERNSLPVASMHYGFFTVGDDGEHTKGATPFVVVEAKPQHDDL